MEGTIGEIRLFAPDFAPKYWAICAGTTLSIAQNQALFSILGTTYGGDGISTFKLPDLRSRVAVGAGQGPSLSSYVLGEVAGVENVSLLTTQIPSHNHTATVTAGTGSSGGSVTINAVDGAGGQAGPGGNLMGEDPNGSTMYCTQAGAGTLVAMNSGVITIDNTTIPPPTVTTGIAGSSMPHFNLQPYLAVNYIICLFGVYPPRN